jgi:hypothetical protein
MGIQQRGIIIIIIIKRIQITITTITAITTVKVKVMHLFQEILYQITLLTIAE